MKRMGAILAGLVLASLTSSPVTARTLIDCPLRDAPFSIESPLVDLLLNPVAKNMLETQAPDLFKGRPSSLTSTKAPTFAAILTVRAMGEKAMSPETLAAIDQRLRAIPVTDVDRAARCARYIAWTRCIGKGRMSYSAIGHRPETYADVHHVRLLENAVRWAGDRREACRAE
ncbi:hypothetical protein [Sphingobium sp. D43FB]|uniref:hypothetical protein n=1 Tax=Sphingobium sp. D43FB TaxID=2017595 RepID=UPI000BB5740F|nr:hypothetical protein [Sphingobium sp. D43FB]PBN44086.1 hypothetical protein SxD43FB_08550 [Sphingobium sp. D43FB]